MNTDMANQSLSEMETLLKRLDKIESQNRLIKIVGIGAIILLFGFIIQAIIPISHIKAERFIICDKQGKEYGWLGIENDLPMLSFTGENFRTSLEPSRLRLQYGNSGSGLIITSEGLGACDLEKKEALQSFNLSLGRENSSPSLSLSGTNARISMDGNIFGISLDTTNLLGVNEPHGLTFAKWEKGLKIGERYWRLPFGSLQ